MDKTCKLITVRCSAPERLPANFSSLEGSFALSPPLTGMQGNKFTVFQTTAKSKAHFTNTYLLKMLTFHFDLILLHNRVVLVISISHFRQCNFHFRSFWHHSRPNSSQCRSLKTRCFTCFLAQP